MGIFAAATVLASGQLFETAAQRDPFTKPGWSRPRDTSAPASGTRKGGSGAGGAVADYGIPPIERRIEFYKGLRESAAAAGSPLPKVTSVLTIDEMSVTGIFRTPRGYAAMIEATPIKLSYTIYPGDKFFDGQLVAVEENRLIFRRVTKVGQGKFTSSVENKPLRQYTDREQIQGTAPVQMEAKANEQPTPKKLNGIPSVAAAPIISPLDEMNRTTPKDTAASKPKKDSAKAVKVAKKQ